MHVTISLNNKTRAGGVFFYFLEITSHWIRRMHHLCLFIFFFSALPQNISQSTLAQRLLSVLELDLAHQSSSTQIYSCLCLSLQHLWFHLSNLERSGLLLSLLLNHWELESLADLLKISQRSTSTDSIVAETTMMKMLHYFDNRWHTQALVYTAEGLEGHRRLMQQNMDSASWPQS